MINGWKIFFILILMDYFFTGISNLMARYGFLKYRWFRWSLAAFVTGEVIAFNCPFDSTSSREEVENCRLWTCPNYHLGKPCIDNFEEDD